MTTAFMSCDPEVPWSNLEDSCLASPAGASRSIRGFDLRCDQKAAGIGACMWAGFAEASLVRTAVAITEMTAG